MARVEIKKGIFCEILRVYWAFLFLNVFLVTMIAGSFFNTISIIGELGEITLEISLIFI